MNRKKQRGLCQALRRREYGKPATQDRNYLLSLGEDITATSCYKNKKCVLPGNPRATFLICFSRDKSRVASTHGDHTVRVSNCRTGHCTHTLTGHPRTPWCIQFHPSSNDLLASGCLGGQVRIWDLVGRGSEVFNPPDKAVIASLAFHPVDKVLLIATGTKLYLWNWDLPTPFICLQTASAEEKVRLVRFSPLGDKILTGITNTASRLMANATAAIQNDPTSMNRLLQSVSCTRVDSNQMPDYLLRPTSTNSSSVGVHVQAGTPNPVASTPSTVTSFDIPSRENSANSSSNLSRETPRTNNSDNVTTNSHSRQSRVETGHLDNNSVSLPFNCNEMESSSSSDTSNPSSSLLYSTIGEPTVHSRHSSIQANSSAYPSLSTTINDDPRRSCMRASGSGADSHSSDSKPDLDPFASTSNEGTVTNELPNNERSSQSNTVNHTPDVTSSSSCVRDSMVVSHSSNSTPDRHPFVSKSNEETVTDQLSNNERSPQSNTVTPTPVVTSTSSCVRDSSFVSHLTDSTADRHPFVSKSNEGTVTDQLSNNERSPQSNGVTPTPVVTSTSSCVRDSSFVSHSTDSTADRRPFVSKSNEGTVKDQLSNNERSSQSNTVTSTPVVASSSSYVRDSSQNNGSLSGNQPVSATQETQESANARNNQQTSRGILAIFRAREGNNWNLDTQEVENEADFARTAADSEGHDVGDSMSFGRIQQDSNVESMTSASTDFGNVLLRTRAFTSELRPNLTSTHETVTISNQENDRNRDSDVLQVEQSNRSVRIDAADESITGMGTVFNVGHNVNPTNLPSGINTSTDSTSPPVDNSGTAIATATARTFRHVHTAVVVAEGANGGPQLALTMAINRAIAGAFAGSGEGAVASNIINTTHRLQWWDFSKQQLPDLKKCDENVVCSSCKIHNDASVDLSSDASMLAAFVPSPYGFPNEGVLAIFSLHRDTLGQCIFRKKFGPNAISVSLSPLNRYVMVGLAARRLHWHLTSRQLIAHIFKLETSNTDETPDTMKPVHCVTHDYEPDRRSHLSVNAAFWHPVVGCGLVYGTNRGHLCMCEIRPRIDEKFASIRRGSY